MNKFIKNIFFYFKRPSAVFIFGSKKDFIADMVLNVAKNKKINLLCHPLDKENYDFNDLKFLVKKSSLPILIISKNKEENQEYEDSELEKILALVRIFPKIGFILADYNLTALRKIKSEAPCYVLTYGLNKEADLFAADVNSGENETNFKINYGGNTIPFWMRKKLSEIEINTFLAGILTLAINKINLVEISQLLKSCDF